MINPLKPNVPSKGNCDNCNETLDKTWYTKLSVFFDQDDLIDHRRKKISILSDWQTEQRIFQDCWVFKCHFLFWNVLLFHKCNMKESLVFLVISRSVSSGYRMKPSHNLLTDLLINYDIIKKMSLGKNTRS
jgi:hypothetical protein